MQNSAAQRPATKHCLEVTAGLDGQIDAMLALAECYFFHCGQKTDINTILDTAFLLQHKQDCHKT